MDSFSRITNRHLGELHLRSVVARLVLLVGLLSVAACSGAEPICTGPASLVDHSKWLFVEEANDPFTTTSTTVRRCGPFDANEEALGGDNSFSIRTVACNYATVEQPSLVAVTKGEPVTFRIWHFSLTAFDSAEANVKLAIDQGMLSSETVQLPSAGDLIFGTIPAPADAPIGTEVLFHIDNHGSNSWNMIELSVQRPAPCPDAGAQ